LVNLTLLTTLVPPGVAISPIPLDSAPAVSARSGDLCPPLSPPTGNVVNVSSVIELQNAVNTATPGDTILVADGIYNLNGVYLRFDVPDVTLRSASGNREQVVLDGNYVTTEIAQIVASNVTIADLTLREAYYHPIHVMSTDGSDTVNTLIYNVHVIDPGQQAIKINPGVEGYYPDEGTIACSHIELTDAGRPQVWNINGSCYTGGVDAHQAQDWVIRDNLIEGFWCTNGLSEHGIHLWRGCRDTLVERNELRDNARGIGFGLEASGSGRTYADDPCPGAGGGYVDHYGGIIRNNFVFASRSELFSSEYGFDCGVCLWQACGAQVVHNTVASTQDPFSSIEWRFDHTDVDIVNNLVTYRLLDRGGTAHLLGNLEHQPLSLFVDGPGGDLHLAATATVAIDWAVSVAAGLCDDDFDGDVRPIGSARDVGADEYGTPPPAAVTNLRVTTAISGTGTLTATLRWTAPTDAVTTTLRYSGTLITQANWDASSLITNTLSGGVEAFTATVPYGGDTVYFAHRAQNAAGDWSDVSNNAFWPHRDVYLPLVTKNW
ncbi:MAG: hypothetical protein SVX38_16140, partial [Chloroflexota bacterium]|nr:hypothetical protein [Chloroflexota bacterium]